MEYQPNSHRLSNINAFNNTNFSNFNQYNTQNYIEKCPLMPVQVRLQKNQQRRLIIQKEKQRYKQNVLDKRRLKQENVQKILKQKQQAKQSAQLIFQNMQKPFHTRYDDTSNWVKVEDIEQKIHQCRTRADQYRTMYKKKIHEDRQGRERSVKQRKDIADKQQREKIVNYHLAEWRSYEMKIAQKYKEQAKNPLRMYENIAKKQDELKQIIKKHLEVNNRHENSQNNIGFKPIVVKPKQNKSAQEIPINSQKQKSSLVYLTHQISFFGLSKSIKNPQKMLKQAKQFISAHVMIEEPTKDGDLIAKFQQYLDLLNDGN